MNVVECGAMAALWQWEWENLQQCKLVLYYIEFVQAHVTKTLTKKVSDRGLIHGMGKCATSLRLRLTHQCIEDLNTSSPPFTQIWFFFFFHRSSFTACLQGAATLPLHGDHLHSLCKRDNYNPIWGHMNHHTTITSFP